jgi:hypothetical protein
MIIPRSVQPIECWNLVSVEGSTLVIVQRQKRNNINGWKRLRQQSAFERDVEEML